MFSSMFQIKQHCSAIIFSKKMKTKQRGFLFISISYLNLLEPGSGLHHERNNKISIKSSSQKSPPLNILMHLVHLGQQKGRSTDVMLPFVLTHTEVCSWMNRWRQRYCNLEERPIKNRRKIVSSLRNTTTNMWRAVTHYNQNFLVPNIRHVCVRKSFNFLSSSWSGHRRFPPPPAPACSAPTWLLPAPDCSAPTWPPPALEYSAQGRRPRPAPALP
jgi:hypothetical protein